MKGLKAIAKKSQNITSRQTWMPLYYSISEQKAYTTDGNGRQFVTYLINPNTEKDIENAITRWLYL